MQCYLGKKIKTKMCSIKIKSGFFNHRENICTKTVRAWRERTRSECTLLSAGRAELRSAAADAGAAASTDPPGI